MKGIQGAVCGRLTGDDFWKVYRGRFIEGLQIDVLRLFTEGGLLKADRDEKQSGQCRS